MKCLVCGQIIDDSSTACPFCGAWIEDSDEDSMYQSFSEYDSPDITVRLTRVSTGEVIIISEFPAVIGRSSKCDIVFRDNPTVGRKHLKISIIGDKVIAEDLNSKNHTYINGKIINDSVEINDVERIRIADEELVVEVNKE